MKTTLILSSLLMALAIPLPATAQGQPVWRCGADGRSYSATPCAEGRVVAVADPRPAADVQAAKDVARREHQLAQSLALDRRQREAVAPGAGLAGIGGRAAAGIKPVAASKKRGSKHPKASRPEDDGTWQAVAPATRQRKG